MTSQTPWYSLQTLSLVLITLVCLTTCALKPLLVNFSELDNHTGQIVSVKGCLGENVTLREILNQGLPLDTQNRFFNFYADCKKTGPSVVLVFVKGDAYFDEGDTITFNGRVEVSSSRIIFLYKEH